MGTIFITKEYNMKKIIRLTENDLTRIVKRVIKEQSILSMPDLGQDVVGLHKTGTRCMSYKENNQIVFDIFVKSRKSTGQPSQNDQKIKNWVTRIGTSIAGTGISSDFTKVLSEIKTPQELGAVLIGYNTKYKRPLYQDLSGEYTISWKTIRTSLSKMEKALKINDCLKYGDPYETQSA
jgi:hypothetical protein